MLFLIPPESIHQAVAVLIRLSYRIPGIRQLIRAVYCIRHPSLVRKVFGLSFPNPVGVAAGFDKDGDMIDGLSNFGFGFIEIGTVTPRAQPGNHKPRLFRLKSDKALINRMGFNNQGVEKVRENIRKHRSKVIIGGNIGKNKPTPNEEALKDYLFCLDMLYQEVDYLVVNVSSPNTPGLRDLQESEPLKIILKELQSAISKKKKKKPLLLKIAPDLTDDQLDQIVILANELQLDGIVATNTTIERKNLDSPVNMVGRIGEGGLSGSPLRKRSTEVIRYLKRKLHDNIPVIGVGGIMGVEDALEKLEAGAELIQIYTGFIYEGPGLACRINRSLINRDQH